MKNKIHDLIRNMTLFEKASLCSGETFWETKSVDRLGIPSIFMSDGPHGLRKENNEDADNVALKSSYPATSFPPAVNMASTWNPELIKEVGQALGEQCINQNIDVILGPGTNIKRSPLCGRNFEYFSEDPFLAGKMASGYIQGTKKTGVGTSLKHFAVNSQESNRMTINEVVDERTFREIYLTPFEIAVKESQPETVMCSYNRINGVFSSDNKYLLTDILRNEWGFEGLVVSDWNALNDRVKGILAGMDLEMPSCGGRTDKEIVKAVLDGSLAEADLDIVVERILTLCFKVIEARDEGYFYNYRDGHKLARRVANESIVLMKNDKNALPIDHTNKIAVIGSLAKTIRYQGAGSSRINPYNLVSFTDYLDSHKLNYEYKEGYKLTNDGYDEVLFKDAIESAKNNDKVILFVGLTDSYECEGYDRKDMTIPTSHSKLIEAISEVNDNLIVVMLGGSPVEMPWIDKVHTLLNAYLPGEAAGEAIADIIYGIVNPSGKLAETYPVKLEDYIGSKYYVGGPKTAEHREGMFVGYRYYDSAKKDVLFPFGHGLSYTTFEYSNLKLSSDKISENDKLTVTFDIKNTGLVDGAEIAQIYVKDIESTIFRPEKELKGFKKVFIHAGETVSVEIELEKRSFAYYNVEIKDWAVESGDFEIMVGASSRDIKLTANVNVKANSEITHPDYKETAPVYYDLTQAEEIPVEQFEAVYGDKMPPNVPAKRGEFDKNTTIGEMKCCIIGKLFCKFAPAVIKSQVPDADMTTMLMLQQGMEEMPMRGLSGVTSGLLDNIVTEGIILWGNKHRMKGLGKMLKGLFLSLKNIRNLSSETKVTMERKKIKEEKKRLKLEREKLIRDQEDHIKALEMEMDELNKILKNIDDPTKLKEYKAQQKKNIQNIKSNIEEIKVQSQKDLEDMRKKGRIEVQSKRTEEKEIKKALKDYLQNMDNNTDTEEEKQHIIALLTAKKRNQDSDASNN